MPRLAYVRVNDRCGPTFLQTRIRSMEDQSQDLTRAAALVRRVVAARGYGIPFHEREDIVQEAMFQIWRALAGSGGADIRSLDGLASVIAHRCCLAWRRRSRPLDPLTPDRADPSPSPEEALIGEEMRSLALRVIGELREGCREILRLHVFLKLTYREIARSLNRSEHGLRTQMFECLQEARAILDRLRRQGGSVGAGAKA